METNQIKKISLLLFQLENRMKANPQNEIFTNELIKINSEFLKLSGVKFSDKEKINALEIVQIMK